MWPGASGTVLAAIHLTREALGGGLIAKINDGDMLKLDRHTGELNLMVPDEELQNRKITPSDLSAHHVGTGRALFSIMRGNVSNEYEGASVFKFD